MGRPKRRSAEVA